MMTTEERILQILDEIAELPEGAGSQTRFVDLSMDSLDMSEFILDVEESFDIELSNDSVMNLGTVGEAVELVERKIAGE